MAELAEYRMTNPNGFFDGRSLRRPGKKPGSDILRVPADYVPSVTWIPLNAPAKVAFQKRYTEVQKLKAQQREADQMRDPIWLMQRIAAGGMSLDALKGSVQAQDELKQKEATIKEMEAELEAMRARADSRQIQPGESIDVPPPSVPVVTQSGSASSSSDEKPAAQGVQGGAVAAAPKRK